MITKIIKQAEYIIKIWRTEQWKEKDYTDQEKTEWYVEYVVESQNISTLIRHLWDWHLYWSQWEPDRGYWLILLRRLLYRMIRRKIKGYFYLINYRGLSCRAWPMIMNSIEGCNLCVQPESWGGSLDFPDFLYTFGITPVTLPLLNHYSMR